MVSPLRNFYCGKQVLVTGHTGFKGSWLSLWLKELGASVVGYALEPQTTPSLFTELNLKSHITSVIGDIRDENCISSVIKKYRPEIVFHLAAQPLVQRAYLEPKLTYETNVMGTINLLESIRHIQCVRSCVVVTSDKCYENKEWVFGYREIDPLGGHDPYSSSKACAELVTTSYRRSFFNPNNYGSKQITSLSTVRAGNVIGGGDWNKNRIIADCVRDLSQKKTIKIRNPHATRPWQYILDPLSGYLILGARMYDDESFGDAWNFGPNDESVITVENLVRLVINHWGDGSYGVSESITHHEAGLLKLDSSKVRSLLNWKPVYSVDEAVKRTVGWYKSFYSGKNGRALNDLTVNEIKDFELAQGRIL